MKKLCAIFMIICFTISLVGCGQGKQSEVSPSAINETQKETPKETSKETPKETGEKGEIVFWSLLGGADGEILDKMIEEYNQTNPAYTVKHYVQDWGEYYNKLTFSVLSGAAPDVCISHATRLLQLADQKVIEPLSDITGAGQIDWNDFQGSAQSITQVDSVPYAVPFDFHGFLLYYNTEILTQAGVISKSDEPISINSFEEFTSMLEKVKQLDVNTNTDHNDDIKPLAMQVDGDVPYKIWYTFYMQQGGTPLLSADGNEVTLDDTAAAKGEEALLSLYKNEYAGVFNNQWEDFKAGKAAFVISLTSDLASFNTALDGNMNVISFPKLFENAKAFSDSHSFAFPVNPNRSEEKEQAVIDFVQWMVNSGEWMQTGHFATSKTVAESEQYHALPFVKNYKDGVNDLTFMSGAKNCWLLSPAKTLSNFEQIYAQRDTITPEEAAALIRAGLEADK